jgi:hypothetical protein
MGASLTMIDRHYGHLAKDGREHAITLLDAHTPGTTSTPWTPRGRARRIHLPPRHLEPAAKQAVRQSPLTDSNRRPLPYHQRARKSLLFRTLPPVGRGRSLRLMPTESCAHVAPAHTLLTAEAVAQTRDFVCEAQRAGAPIRRSGLFTRCWTRNVRYTDVSHPASLPRITAL